MFIAIISILSMIISFILTTRLYLINPNKQKDNLIGHILFLLFLIASLFALGWKVFFAGLATFFLSKLLLYPLAIRSASNKLKNTFDTRENFSKVPPKKFMNLSKAIYFYYANPFTIKNSVEDTTKSILIDVLISICYNLPQNRDFIKEYNISKADFKKTFDAIVAEGGALWAGVHFIPASAIAYSQTLNFLRIGGINSKAINSLVMYFERGIPLGY